MQAIQMWRWSYDHGWFVRWSIVDEKTSCAVGTVELFRRASDDSYDGDGILRLDLRSDYEQEAAVTAILAVILPPSFGWFGCGRIATKAEPVAQARIRALSQLGFAPGKEPLYGHDGTAYGDYWIAEEGECLYRLAMKHIYGDGVSEDNVLAVRLLTRARELGHVEAAYNLGICFHYGYGTEVDLKKAYELYLESATAGYGKGMELVGRFYNRGIFVEKHREQAEFWLRKAIASGDPEAAAEAKKELEE